MSDSELPPDPDSTPKLCLDYPTIFTIPSELTHRILIFCRPKDVASFSQTCRLANQITQDEYLYRQIWYAYPFDDPQGVIEQRHTFNLPTNPDMLSDGNRWKQGLSRRVKAEGVAFMKQKDLLGLSHEDKQDALQLLVSVIKSLPAPGNEGDRKWSANMEVSRDVQWLERILRNSKLITPDSVDSGEISQLQARLRSCVGDIQWSRRTRQQMSDKRNKSRAFVYDLRNYFPANQFGPFRPNGTVNWIHAEHLINVVLANLHDLPSHLTHARPLSSLESFRPYSAPGGYSQSDWAGVEGTWRRYVCFMDYRDLFAFNYSDIADGPRHPKFFEDPRFREATRLIQVKLRIISPADIRFFAKSEIVASASPKHPVTFFTGSSRGVHGNEAIVEGFVRMAGDGTVRWKFVSIYDHSPQWSSNGVQLGDVGSARGVVGVWTTTTHEQGDPIGPFWLWKVEDDCSDELMEYT